MLNSIKQKYLSVLGYKSPSSESLWELFRQLITFGGIGLSGVAVGLGTLNLCMILWRNFPVANMIAFLVAVTWNFFLNRRFTFKPVDKPLFRQWLEFAIACLGGTVVNWIVSMSLYYNVSFFNAHYNFAALAGVAAGCLFNFTSSRLYVFKDTNTKKTLICEETIVK